MTYKNLSIFFKEQEPLYFEELDLIAVAMNGFLVVAKGDERYYYNLDSIGSYLFREIEDEEEPNPRDNLHVIN